MNLVMLSRAYECSSCNTLTTQTFLVNAHVLRINITRSKLVVPEPALVNSELKKSWKENSHTTSDLLSFSEKTLLLLFLLADLLIPGAGGGKWLSLSSVKVVQSCPTLQPHEIYSPWKSPGQNTGVGSLSLLKGIFPTQGWTQVSRIAGRFFTSRTTREAPLSPRPGLFQQHHFPSAPETLSPWCFVENDIHWTLGKWLFDRNYP